MCIIDDQFDYNGFITEEINKKKRDKSYRYFNNINRIAANYPNAKTGDNKDVTVWCSNDYLGMSRNPLVVNAVKEAVEKHGAGAGGTRNIAGNAGLHEVSSPFIYSFIYLFIYLLYFFLFYFRTL